MPSTTLEPRLGRRLHSGMQIFVKTEGLQNLDENQKTKTPGKILAGDAHDAAARPLPGPRQDPCRRHPRGRSQAHTCQDSTAVPMQLPAQQLGEHLRGEVQPLGQLNKHLRGGMQIFVKTLPPHRLSSQLASVALHASSARMRVKARRGGDSWYELPCRPR